MKSGLLLAIILLVAVVVRVRLISNGGQFYWPDETRYEDSRDLVAAMTRGDVAGAFGKLDKAEHLFFRVFGVVPAAIERAAGQHAQIPALFFGMGSVASILLLWAIARRAGAGDLEALAAAGFLALSSTFFYYSRHLVPYDLAMALGLLAMLVGLGPNASRMRSVMCGLLACLAVLTYEGYWALGVVAVVVHVAGATGGDDSFLRRGLLSACGLVTLPIAAVSISAVLGGHLLASFVEFSQSVNQGNTAEGWSLPFEYLWHAEHLLLVLWLVALASCIWHLARGDASTPTRIGLLGACGIYAALAASSTVLHLFVVYGRMARQLVPFLCLLAAHEIERLRGSRLRAREVLVGAVVVLAVVQGIVNVREPMRLVFPSEFRARAEALVQGDPSRYAFVNAEHIYPWPRRDTPRASTTIAQARHPLEFLPYQYEGYDPEQRAALRRSDITMRLVMFGATD